MLRLKTKKEELEKIEIVEFKEYTIEKLAQLLLYNVICNKKPRDEVDWSTASNFVNKFISENDFKEIKAIFCNNRLFFLKNNPDHFCALDNFNLLDTYLCVHINSAFYPLLIANVPKPPYSQALI